MLARWAKDGLIAELPTADSAKAATVANAARRLPTTSTSDSTVTDLPAARELIEQLGTFVQHAANPYGPLGYLLFGFRVDRVGDGEPCGQLSVQALAGDPPPAMPCRRA